MRSRFVRPGTRRLELSDGDWLLVRRRLTVGESDDASRQMYEYVNNEWRVKLQSVTRARILAYLLDWSLVDQDGKPVVIFGQDLHVIDSALRQLDPEDFAEIREAIERHEAEMLAEREAEKKTRTGATASEPISPLPVAVAGHTSG